MRKKILKLFMFFVIISIICFFGVVIYVKSSPKLEINSVNSFIMYDNEEQVFFQGNQSMEWVNLDNISNYLIDSTIYTEDKKFYDHFGFDILRIISASFTNLVNRDTIQGASTITQQYAKNLFLDFDKTWSRKWDEMWYTLRIEDDYSKDEILEGYLNTINYGHGMYGIENASKYYFGIHASELNLAQASILSGIPKAPSNYSPLIDLDMAKSRQLIVLNALVDNEIITQDEADLAYAEELNFIGEIFSDDLSTIMYYQDAVLNELESITSIPNTFTETNGLKIYTSLDLDIQKELENTVKNSIPEESLIQTSAVMMDPDNGRVLALVGGRDYNVSSYNRVTDSYRQVGSTMKPYLYYSALENGFTASSAFISEATTFTFSDQDDYSPQNYGGTYANKPISMAAAIAYSENIYAVKTHLFLGSEALINTARRVGISAELEDIASLPLGTNEISITEMAAGYSAFANLGNKVDSHLILKIEDMDGNVLYTADEYVEPVLNSSLCYILNNMLTTTYNPNYVDYNYPTALSLSSKLQHTYSLKSGTTDTDNWYIGYNQDILSAVWVGYDDNTPLVASEYKYAQSIWFDSVEYYNLGSEDNWYTQPENVSAVLVDPISGKPVSQDSTKSQVMYFIKGSEPTGTEAVFDEHSVNNFPS